MINLITAWIVWLYYVPFIGWLLATAFVAGIVALCYLIVTNLLEIAKYLDSLKLAFIKDMLFDKDQTVTKNLLYLTLIAFLIRLMIILND